MWFSTVRTDNDKRCAASAAASVAATRSLIRSKSSDTNASSSPSAVACGLLIWRQPSEPPSLRRKQAECFAGDAALSSTRRARNNDTGNFRRGECGFDEPQLLGAADQRPRQAHRSSVYGDRVP